MDAPVSQPPASAFEVLAESSYGFTFVDLGITDEDLMDFDRIAIEKNKDLNEIGHISRFQRAVQSYLLEIGPNDSDLVERAARRINEIAMQVLDACGKEYAWLCLRATTPTHLYDTPRWHIDGHYYKSWPHYRMQYKFVLTLIGPSTLFYPLPRDEIRLRREIWRRMRDRNFTSQACPLANAIPMRPRGEGAFFIVGNTKTAAIHSEPKSDRGHRLFFSIVPCNQEDLEFLQVRVNELYISS